VIKPISRGQAPVSPPPPTFGKGLSKSTFFARFFHEIMKGDFAPLFPKWIL